MWNQASLILHLRQCIVGYRNVVLKAVKCTVLEFFIEYLVKNRAGHSILDWQKNSIGQRFGLNFGRRVGPATFSGGRPTKMGRLFGIMNISSKLDSWSNRLIKSALNKSITSVSDLYALDDRINNTKTLFIIELLLKRKLCYEIFHDSRKTNANLQNTINRIISVF